MKPPVFHTSTFVFRTAQDGKEFFELDYGLRQKRPNEEPGLIYSRINNPDLEVLEDRLDPAVLGKVGFCLDTCHAHAGGEELSGVVDRVKAATGRVDLMHCNDSRDEFDSGADRHANFGQGHIEGDDLVAVVSAAGAPVVCETPGGAEGQAADIAWLRERLPA